MTNELVDDGDLWDAVDLFDDIDPAIPGPGDKIPIEWIDWLCNSIPCKSCGGAWFGCCNCVGGRVPYGQKKKPVVSLQMELI